MTVGVEWVNKWYEGFLGPVGPVQLLARWHH